MLAVLDRATLDLDAEFHPDDCDLGINDGKVRDRHDIGESQRGHTAWYAEQRAKAGGSKETGVIPMRYLVVVEQDPSSYGAHVPDLPGCIAAGETKEEVLSLIREAIEFHIEGLKRQGQPIPGPASMSELVEVEAA
ncbi:MAG TPA: type II toxin-antitoxin system HicB family antitoxin [Burkholderiales bacterium]|nr:type II toxin-antitoxin system HicB family antitoxin [Burkholderiales bacterium]